ncbi:MAG: hypothetical protein ACREOR_09955 [Candidatus Binatia bacterium]
MFDFTAGAAHSDDDAAGEQPSANHWWIEELRLPTRQNGGMEQAGGDAILLPNAV